MKKVLVVVAIVALAAAGGALAWKLAGDDGQRRVGGLTLQTAPQTFTGATPDYAIYTSSTTVPFNSIAEPSRYCPLGRRVLGGGHVVSRYHDLFGSYPSGNGHHVRLRNLGTEVQLTSYAVCASVATYEILTKAVEIPSGTGGWSEGLTCPAGKTPAAGGFNASGTGTTLVMSRPDQGDGWDVIATRGSSARQGTAYVVCVSVSGYSRHQVSHDFQSSTEKYDVAAYCPDGKKVLGGGFGFAALGGGGSAIDAALEFDGRFNSYPTSTAWHVHVAVSGHGTGRVTAHVVCGTID